MSDLLNVGFCVATGFQECWNTCQIRDRVEVSRSLLAAEAPIQICAESNMKRVACDLTNVIDMFNQAFEFQADAFRRRLASNPVGDQHPGIERATNHGAAPDEVLNLFVSELPMM